MKKALLSVIAFMSLGFSTPEQLQPNDTETQTTDPEVLIELEAPLVLETDNHHQPVTEETQAELRELAESLPSDYDAISTNQRPAQSTYASASGNIGVTFNSDSPAPAAVQTVVMSAIQQWESALTTNPNGPIEVEVHWTSLGSTNNLAQAGPEGYFRSSALPTTDFYPAPLANTLLGIDANGANRPEITITLNSDLVSINRWHISNTENPQPYQIDLYSTVLHELGHGLGFIGSAHLNDASLPELNNIPFIYDTITQVNGTPLTNLPHSSSNFSSNNLDIDLGGGNIHKLYAPSTWKTGSSYSHFDETQYPHGTAGSLMTPVLHAGKADRKLDAAVLGVMKQIGWEVHPPAATPTIQTTQATTTSIKVTWMNNLALYGVPPTSFTIQAIKNGTVVKNITASGTNRQTTITGLDPNTPYTIKVSPIADTISGVSASRSVTTQKIQQEPTPPTTPEPEPEPEKPTSTAPTIRNVPLDSQVYRLYKAYFLRSPDKSGFSYWIQQRAKGTSPEIISQAFADSPEFKQRYGNLTNKQFITLIYKNVLGRTPDQTGLNYWTTKLNQGASRGNIMLAFSESTENITKTKTVRPNTSLDGKILRLYRAYFLRNPDTRYWHGVYGQGTPLATVSQAFADSPEFKQRYGNLTNKQFITLIYKNVLGRTPDQTGLNYWTTKLNQGASRGNIMLAFSESTENITKIGYLP